MTTLLVALIVGAAFAALWLGVAQGAAVITHHHRGGEGCDRTCHRCTCSTLPFEDTLAFEGAPRLEATPAEEEPR